MDKPDPKAVLKLALSSLDDDLHDMTDEEVKQEIAEAGVDLAESERRWMQVGREDAMTDRTDWKAPCVLCGYNGPGFFQPATHPCAAHKTERDAMIEELALLKNARDDYRTEVERLRVALEAVMDACDPESYCCGAWYVAKEARGLTEKKP